MPINYLLKIISACAVILLVIFSENLNSMNSKYSCVLDFKNEFGSYSMIDMSESPYWARLIDSKIGKDGSASDDIRKLIDKEFEDQDEYLKLIKQNNDIFYLNAFDSIFSSGQKRVRNILVASDKAKGYIERKTGVALSDESVSIIIPSSYNLGDLSAAKKSLKYFEENS